VFLAYPPQNLYPIDPRHHDVQEDRVQRVLLDNLETFLPTAGDESLVAFILKGLSDEERNSRVIIDDENSHGLVPLHPTYRVEKRLSMTRLPA